MQNGIRWCYRDNDGSITIRSALRGVLLFMCVVFTPVILVFFIPQLIWFYCKSKSELPARYDFAMHLEILLDICQYAKTLESRPRVNDVKDQIRLKKRFYNPKNTNKSIDKILNDSFTTFFNLEGYLDLNLSNTDSHEIDFRKLHFWDNLADKDLEEILIVQNLKGNCLIGVAAYDIFGKSLGTSCIGGCLYHLWDAILSD